ncbi:MAG: serine--tRNA ligase [Myxococcota bacterium]
MLDPRLITDEPDRVKQALTRRNQPELHALVDELLALAATRSDLIGERDELRNQRNVLSKEIGALYKQGKRDEAETAKATVQAGNTRISELEALLTDVEAKRTTLSLELPNIPDEDVPQGKSEADNSIVRQWGTPRELDFEAQSHVEVGANLGILDLERSAKLTGARFAVLTGHGARLERALINLFLDMATTEHGYTEVLAPYIVHRRILEGTTQLPKFEDGLFKLEGQLNGSDAFLIPTAEVPITNLHREEILEEAELPKKYAGFTPCFRSEAGAAGRDVRGIIRQHQFHKVELVQVCRPQDSEAAHEALTAHAEAVLQRLELPYRVALLCTGDLSFGARRCYDIEVWLPSQGAYREISSCSNFGAFQTRRMQLRWRPEAVDGKKSKPRLAHTLNGSALAVGRTLVAILENGQQADGSVVLPAALVPYMGGTEVLRPA